MIRIITFSVTDEKLAAQAYEIRRQVFVVEQQVDPALEYDREEESTHYLAYDNDLAVATARWRTTTDGIKLERFATLQDCRNKSIGAQILQKVMDDVLPLKKEIYLHAQLKAVPFYKKYGFVTVGPTFWEAGIEHFKMVYLGMLPVRF